MNPMPPPDAAPEPIEEGVPQFDNFRAARLYCPKCGGPREVRERLLLVLPNKEIFDYLCTGCASSLGTREVAAGEARLEAALRARMARRRRPSAGRAGF